MTATTDRRTARYRPGADLLGCVVVEGEPGDARVCLRCPCQVAFWVAATEAAAAAKKALVYRCAGCGRGERLPGENGVLRSEEPPKRNTVGAALLLTAFELWGEGEFDAAALTVAAWRRDKARFGLRGFEQQHPDYNRVKVELCKTRTTAFSRYIVRVRENTFALTAAGLSAAVKMRDAGGGDEDGGEAE